MNNEISFTKLGKYFSDRVALDLSELAEISAKFSRISAKKNQFLLRAGDVCNAYYFVEKGCIRLFTISDRGEEMTRHFAFEGTFGTALPSLIDKRPSFDFVQTTEKSSLLCISRQDFFDLVDRSVPFARIYREILELAFIHAQRRIYNFQGMNASEKVAWTLANQPILFQRVSNRLLASYLGITASTLSRVKSRKIGKY